MSIKDLIREALESDNDGGLLSFNHYKIEKYIRGGEQGAVFQVINEIERKFALKLYTPTYEGQSKDDLTDKVKQFFREIKILSKLNHKNIVRVLTGGVATWCQEPPQWESVKPGILTESETQTITLNDNQCLFYIMDYIDGADVSELFSKTPNDEVEGILKKYSLIELFETLILQVSTGMHFYGSEDVTHKDIKSSNIRYSKSDHSFIIVDFGFARHLGSVEGQKNSGHEKVHMDLSSIQAQGYEKHDMCQFAKLLIDVWPRVKSKYDKRRQLGIIQELDRASSRTIEARHEDMVQLLAKIRQHFMIIPEWQFALKLGESFCPGGFGRFVKKLRIPVSGSIYLSKEVEALVDTSTFQRLRGVRQLGPAMFVFPGANHTRFEHSLGTYHLSLRYLEKLLGVPGFSDICDPLDSSIKLLILSALLHDVGHYPYSHWIEEMGDLPNCRTLPKHEKRAEEMLKDGGAKEIIEDVWGVELKDVTDIIEVNPNNERAVFLSSLISSIIDVDKVDYLIRDSLHCGVNYGSGIDLERLLDSLYVDNENKRVCITDKGRSALFSIVTCRNIMYQEIYWHKTVRLCEAMFKRFFFEHMMNPPIGYPETEELLKRSDDHFISILFEKWKDRDNAIANLIAPFAFEGRGEFLYKPVYDYVRGQHENSQMPIMVKKRYSGFFGLMLEMKFPQLVEVSKRLSIRLKEDKHDVEITDIIVEISPKKNVDENDKVSNMRIWNIRNSRFESASKFLDSLAAELNENRHSYIFCHQKHYDYMRQLVENDKLSDILSELTQELKKEAV